MTTEISPLVHSMYIGYVRHLLPSWQRIGSTRFHFWMGPTSVNAPTSSSSLAISISKSAWTLTPLGSFCFSSSPATEMTRPQPISLFFLYVVLFSFHLSAEWWMRLHDAAACFHSISINQVGKNNTAAGPWNSRASLGSVSRLWRPLSARVTSRSAKSLHFRLLYK